jgi:transcriptional regulator with AAA-type ATPase domain
VRKQDSRPEQTTVEPGAPAGSPPPRFLLATALGGVHLHALPLQGEAVLGRGRECQVVLDYASISRQHARLRIGATCTLSDLGSRNGTLFRGERLGPGDEREIGYGDSFSIGPVSLLLVPPAAEMSPSSLAGSRLRIDDPAANDPVLTAIAQARLAVIIHGETGVGKEVLAQTLHRLSGRKGPLLAVNCASLSETLLESELFGHEKGAFTGAVQAKPGLLQAAAGGTLLLDEIGEMALSLQAKLLRAIETQSVLPVGGVRPVAIDVRFLAATHRNLLVQIDAGEFRRDLYYRLAGFSLEIPPLREREKQIPKLALEILAGRARLTPAATEKLQAHDWPGNVRELRNVLERTLVLARGGEIDAIQLMFDDLPEDTTLPPTKGDDERARILAALDACAGNQTRAARKLGMSRTTFVQKLIEHRIPRPRKAH